MSLKEADPKVSQSFHVSELTPADRKVPLWAKVAVLLCILAFIGLFMAFAASVGGDTLSH